jgi:hypothetical protein
LDAASLVERTSLRDALVLAIRYRSVMQCPAYRDRCVEDKFVSHLAAAFGAHFDEFVVRDRSFARAFDRSNSFLRLLRSTAGAWHQVRNRLSPIGNCYALTLLDPLDKVSQFCLRFVDSIRTHTASDAFDAI